MSLSGLMTAVVEYAADVIVNDCGRPIPDRVQRYHDDMPHVCCSENGMLAINWTTEQIVGGFPTVPAPQPCNGFPVSLLNLKYVVCWPPLDVSKAGAVLPEIETDAIAAMLADVADCVLRALNRLQCSPDLTDPLQAAVLLATGPSRFRPITVTPLAPRGLCAGVRWSMYAAVRTPMAVS